MEFPKLPPHSGSVLSVVDMHTGGEPLRIILSGYPEVKGDTILAKRRYVREHLDHLRKLLMFEPRGHYDMYGALLVKSELAEADLGVLFMHNEGYSTMCGQAVTCQSTSSRGKWAGESERSVVIGQKGEVGRATQHYSGLTEYLGSWTAGSTVGCLCLVRGGRVRYWLQPQGVKKRNMVEWSY